MRGEAVSVLLLAALAAPLAAAGATRQTPIQPLGLTDTGGELFIRGHLKTKSETAADGSKTDESEDFFEETMEIRGKGYVYHPNLLEWFGSVRGGFVQEQITVNSQNQPGNGTLSGYNVNGLFLREKPVSLALFSSKSKEFIDRDFASTTQLETSRNGGEIILKGNTPMSLLFEKVDVQDHSGLRLDDRSTRHVLFTAADQRSPDRLLEFRYDREDTDETVTFMPTGSPPTIDNLPFVRDEFDLSSLIRFGPEELRSRFGAHVRTVDRQGAFPDQVRAGDVSLDLAHTRSFSTFYRAIYNLDQTDIDSDRTINGEAGFIQHVYESLDITGRLARTNRQFNQGSEDVGAGFLNLDYRKNTPIGRYTSAMLVGREKTEEQSPTGQESVRGEAVTLVGLGYFALSRTNVLANTIVVSNLTRTIIYAENVDYVVRVTGATTEISRLAAGGIANGDTVLVDYSIGVANMATWTTDHFAWSNRLQLEKVPVGIYYNYHLRDDRLRSGDNPGNLDTQKSHLGGADLTWNNLNVVVEREIRDQLLFPPWTADRARARYLLRVARDIDLTVGASAERLVYRNAQQFGFEPGRDRLNSYDAYGRLSAKLQQNLLLRADAEYLQTSGRENRKLAQVSVGLEWVYRDLEVTVEARQSTYQQEQNSGAVQALLFTVRRRF